MFSGFEVVPIVVGFSSGRTLWPAPDRIKPCTSADGESIVNQSSQFNPNLGYTLALVAISYLDSVPSAHSSAHPTLPAMSRARPAGLHLSALSPDEFEA